MPFDPRSMRAVSRGVAPAGSGSSLRDWRYATKDDRDTVLAAGYWNAASGGLKVGDTIMASVDLADAPEGLNLFVAANDGDVEVVPYGGMDFPDLDVEAAALPAFDVTGVKGRSSTYGLQLPTIPSRAVAATRALPVWVQAIHVLGFDAPGDGGGGIYQRVVSGSSYGAAFQDAAGAWWEIVGDRLSVRQFGFTGSGTLADTARVQSALHWLGVSSYRCLVWDIASAQINGALTLPEANYWTINTLGGINIVQVMDNEPIFIFRGSAANGYGRWQILGQVRTAWANNQPVGNTKSISLAIYPRNTISNGYYNYKMGRLICVNGHTAIGLHPDLDPTWKCPQWGFDIEYIEIGLLVTGRAIHLAPTEAGVAGAPVGHIGRVYIRGDNCLPRALNFVGYNELVIDLIEVNFATNSLLYFTSCPNVEIGVFRIESGTWATQQSLVTASGSDTMVTFRSVECYNITTPAGDYGYGFNAYGGAMIQFLSSINLDTVTRGNLGNFFLFHPTVSGTTWGKIIHPRRLRWVNHTGAGLYAVQTSEAKWVSAARVTEARFTKTDITAAGQLRLSYDGTTAWTDHVMTHAGNLRGITVRTTAALAGATVTFAVYINGAPVTGGSVTVAVGATTGEKFYGPFYDQAAAATHRLAIDDVVTVQMTVGGVVTSAGNAEVRLSFADVI